MQSFFLSHVKLAIELKSQVKRILSKDLSTAPINENVHNLQSEHLAELLLAENCIDKLFACDLPCNLFTQTPM